MRGCRGTSRLYKVEFRCPCGAVNPVAKRGRKVHGPGHVKDLYCPVCRKTTKQIQLTHPAGWSK